MQELAYAGSLQPTGSASRVSVHRSGAEVGCEMRRHGHRRIANLTSHLGSFAAMPARTSKSESQHLAGLLATSTTKHDGTSIGQGGRRCGSDASGGPPNASSSILMPPTASPSEANAIPNRWS